MRVIHITTVPKTLFFLCGQAAFLRDHGFEMHVVSSPGDDLDTFASQEKVVSHAIPMRRAISPLQDLITVFRLWKLFRRLKPRVVHSHTPKGGLLGMIASTLARTPVRVYHVHGLPLVTSHGLRRSLLWLTERVSCLLATRVFCVSRSVRELAISLRLVSPSHMSVLANGSINGVDAEVRFRPSRENQSSGMAVRARCGISADAPVVGFVGRIVRDKGVLELAQAWSILRERFPMAHLLMVGAEEAQDPVPPVVMRNLRADPRVHLVGHDRDTPPYFSAMDVLALPTYREGFVVTALEAAAMEVPVVGTNVPGCVDAVVEAETGTVIPARDPGALAEALARYIADPGLRRRHGTQGRARVLRDYSPELIWRALLPVYSGGPHHSVQVKA